MVEVDCLPTLLSFLLTRRITFIEPGEIIILLKTMDKRLLDEQSAETSAAVIEILKSDTGFQQLAAAEGAALGQTKS